MRANNTINRSHLMEKKIEIAFHIMLLFKDIEWEVCKKEEDAEECAGYDYDLILVDMHMPKKYHYRFLKKIIRAQKNKDKRVAIVMMSTAPQEILADFRTSVPFLFYLEKPFREKQKEYFKNIVTCVQWQEAFKDAAMH